MKKGNIFWNFAKEDRMVYVSMPQEGIARAGYDPQCEVLEIEFTSDKSVYRFWGVSEEDWHNFRKVPSARIFLQTYIMGRCNLQIAKETTQFSKKS